ncbi:hypothetical protein OCH239_04315 [Roseivivax halodurans JCM 10272]|uniref:Uncharacterized protein n=1 Tax=Roseivivax halodurans JCM 10272 TaxID=1449350 RepID=X7EEM5_9RHOB|nr:hypothetical protein [Roseivivax halodurans]ETX14315.1 hypothetical protein OCH239_04315 [Roseivivax halodurans JCM 10272]
MCAVSVAYWALWEPILAQVTKEEREKALLTKAMPPSLRLH